MNFKFQLINEISEVGDVDRVEVNHTMHSASDNIDSLVLSFKRFLNLTGFNWNVIHAYVPITPHESRITGLDVTFDDSDLRSGPYEGDDDIEDVEDEGHEVDPEMEKYIEMQANNPAAMNKFMNLVKSNKDIAQYVFQLYLEDMMYE